MTLAKDQPGNPVKLAGQSQLRQHPVNSVWLFVDILQEQDLTLSIDFVWGTHCGRNQCQVSSCQSPAGLSGSDRTQWVRRAKCIRFSWICHHTRGTGIKQRLSEMFLRIVCKTRQENRTVKSDESCMLVNGKMHCRDVAIPYEDLRVLSDKFIIDAVQNVFGAISTSNCNHRLHFRIAKHRMKIIQTFLN